MVRPYRPEDAEEVLDLWREGGGWYRTTLPVEETSFVGALRRLSAGDRRAGRRAPRTNAWVHPDTGEPSAFLFASVEPDLSYVAPLLRSAAAGPEVLDLLLDAAEGWFRSLGVDRYRTEAPALRERIGGPLRRRGRSLWRRIVYRLGRYSPDGPVDARVRPFHHRDRGALGALALQKFPDGYPPPVPVPFVPVGEVPFELFARAPSGTRIWVLGEGTEALAIAGATHFGPGPVAEIGPFLLKPGLEGAAGRAVLRAPLLWVRSLGIREVRASVPEGLVDERRALESEGFEPLAEAEIIEVRLAPPRRSASGRGSGTDGRADRTGTSRV